MGIQGFDFYSHGKQKCSTGIGFGNKVCHKNCESEEIRFKFRAIVEEEGAFTILSQNLGKRCKNVTIPRGEKNCITGLEILFFEKASMGK